MKIEGTIMVSLQICHYRDFKTPSSLIDKKEMVRIQNTNSSLNVMNYIKLFLKMGKYTFS